MRRALSSLVMVALMAAMVVAVPTTALAADTYEPNDEAETAYGPLEASSDVHTLVSYIYTENDLDYYELKVDEPCHLRSVLQVPGGVDYHLYLLDDIGTTDLPWWNSIAKSDKNGDGVDEAIDYTITTPGTYYLVVYGSSDDFSQSSPYTLYVRFPKGGDTHEFNDDAEHGAGPLRSDEAITSYIFTENDLDYYIVNVSSPSHLLLSLEVPDGVDYHLYLLDDIGTTDLPWWNSIAKSDENGDGVDEQIDYTIQEPGKYYAVVYGSSDDYSQSSPYVLRAECDGMSVCTRIAGETRIETAVEVSQQAFPFGSDYAVIATAYNYPDALAGAVLAHAYDAPLLLTETDDLPRSIDEELDRLGVKDAFLLGGVGAIGGDVEDEVNDSDTLVKRIAGADRYETARLIAEQVEKKRGEPSTAVVATGQNFADALAASPYAAAKGYPIVLTAPTGLSPSAAQALDSLGVDDVLVMGGPGAVSSTVENQIEARGLGTTRIQGSTRIGTAVAMAEYACDDGFSMERPLLATGFNFPDALAGGVLGAKMKSPLLLTDATSLSAETKDYLTSQKTVTEEVIVLGGYGAVSGNTIIQVDQIY